MSFVGMINALLALLATVLLLPTIRCASPRNKATSWTGIAGNSAAATNNSLRVAKKRSNVGAAATNDSLRVAKK